MIDSIKSLTQFRETLYQRLGNQKDAQMQLIDALCSYPEAKTVVELSLAPCFERGHASLYAAVSGFNHDETILSRLASPYLPPPKQQPFWLLGVDVTPLPRPFAKTTEDLSLVYEPNQVYGNKPIVVGHQYSTVVLLPDHEEGMSKSWVVPLSTKRVRTGDDKELVGSQQISALLNDSTMPFHQQLVVQVADSSYSKRGYLYAQQAQDKLVTICRAANNRVFFHAPLPSEEAKQAGHPRWYGERFSLSDPTSWSPPDEEALTAFTSSRGKQYEVQLTRWNGLLMRGKKIPTPLPMQNHPFDLVRVHLVDPETKKRLYTHDLWLVVMGEQRQELSLLSIYEGYNARYHLEHFFRYGKQKLLFTAFQTPETETEEKWWQLAHLAYLQLWVARQTTTLLPKPWEKNLPRVKTNIITPSMVQRGFERIIQQIGTPAKSPKRRGYSAGWISGVLRVARERRMVVKQGKKGKKASKGP